MKKLAIVFTLSVILLFGTFSSATAAVNSHANENSNRAPIFIPGNYIVVLEDGFSPQDVAKGHGVSPKFVYKKALNGFSAPISPIALDKLKEDSRVKYVEQDQIYTIATQELPTGVDRINADTNAIANIDGVDDRVPAVIAVLDTGVDIDHPDLNVSPSYGIDCSNGFICWEGPSYANDDHDHGTHVAGIAAALDNGIGVVGVAPGATIVPIKVLKSDGSGSLSGVLAGIDYVTLKAYYIDVANMSLTGGFSSAFNNAVAQSVAAGVVYVVAAGNDSSDSSNFSPASEPSAITVSAIADFDGVGGGLNDQTASFSSCTESDDDSFACFSNYGYPVDIAAPGVWILSTVIGGYQAYSGTSMASPHVAGAAALIRSQDYGMTPAQVKTVLIDMAIPQNSQGGFSGDPDGYPEPLLNLGQTPSPNQIPIAEAGGDKNAQENTIVNFNGTASYDPDGDELSFTWTQTSGPVITLSNSDTAFPSFTTPTIFQNDVLIFSLVVNDGLANSAADYISVWVTDNINEPPTADAGPNQSVNDSEGDGEMIQLDGSASSDPNNEVLNFKWLENNIAIGTGMTLDHLFMPGIHTVTLEVTDSRGDSDSDIVVITVLESDPSVTITSPQSGTIEGKVTVSAAAENFSGLLTFWLVGSNSVTLGTTDSPYQVSFHTKNFSPGDYQITANDSNGNELASVDVTIPSKGGGNDGGGGGGVDCNAKPNHPKCR